MCFFSLHLPNITLNHIVHREKTNSLEETIIMTININSLRFGSIFSKTLVKKIMRQSFSE